MNKKFAIGQSIFFAGDTGWPAMRGTVVSKKGSNRVRVKWDTTGPYKNNNMHPVWINLSNIFKTLF